jgi:hypothetical protein
MAMKRMCSKDIFVTHSMKSVTSTVLNEKGFQYDMIEAELAHIDTNEVKEPTVAINIYNNQEN